MWGFSISRVIYFHGPDVTEIPERHRSFLVGFPERCRFRTAVCRINETARKPPQSARDLCWFLHEENFFFILYYRHVHRMEGDWEIYFVHILYFSCSSFGRSFFISSAFFRISVEL